ncbi:outer membrane lipoprotein-sorting protein [Candidatus Uabimicrobium sp. HlEnr_7]|uniref:outer membrane lipoprotein-sorting protein n=1 Tax=Candidatus Uabimicrobium helgolandensis TaxID=3095367 RepID=UPI0035580FC6
MKYFYILTLFICCCYAQKAKLTADTIVQRSIDAAFYSGEDRKAITKLFIYDKKGNVRERFFTVLRTNLSKKEQNYYMHFVRPTDVRNSTFLTIKKQDKDDQRWLYFPALDFVKRIAPSKKRTSFVGSHFYYEDTTGRKIEDDKHQLAKITDDYYLIKSTPIKKDVEFSYYISWINRKHFLPVKIVYYNKKKQKYRILSSLKIELIQNYPTITKQQVEDLNRKGKTILISEKVEYNIGLTKSIFNETSLRNPPIKWLK